MVFMIEILLAVKRGALVIVFRAAEAARKDDIGI